MTDIYVGNSLGSLTPLNQCVNYQGGEIKDKPSQRTHNKDDKAVRRKIIGLNCRFGNVSDNTTPESSFIFFILCIVNAKYVNILLENPILI